MIPNNPAIIDSLGWVLYKQGKYEEALQQLQIAYSRFPDHEVAAHIVEVLAEMDRDEEALELLAVCRCPEPRKRAFAGGSRATLPWFRVVASDYFRIWRCSVRRYCCLPVPAVR